MYTFFEQDKYVSVTDESENINQKKQTWQTSIPTKNVIRFQKTEGAIDNIFVVYQFDAYTSFLSNDYIFNCGLYLLLRQELSTIDLNSIKKYGGSKLSLHKNGIHVFPTKSNQNMIMEILLFLEERIDSSLQAINSEIKTLIHNQQGLKQSESALWEMSVKASHLVVFGKKDGENHFFYEDLISLAFHHSNDNIFQRKRTVCNVSFKFKANFSKDLQEKIRTIHSSFPTDKEFVLDISKYRISISAESLKQRKCILMVFNIIIKEIDPSLAEIANDFHNILNVSGVYGDDFILQKLLKKPQKIPSDIGIVYSLTSETSVSTQPLDRP